MTGSTLAAGGIGFVALLALGIVSAIPAVTKLTPGGLLGPATELAANSATVADMGWSDLGLPVVSTIVLIGACVALSVWSFSRQEL